MIAAWIDAQPIPERPVDDEAAWTRGSALFASECASCHAGDALTNDQTIDVGTGGAFQVPSLRGLAYRAPYLHDGSAATVADVLARHGAAALDDGARADLLAYARSL